MSGAATGGIVVVIEQWADLQQQFVDQPQPAVGGAQRLVAVVMNERGYPAHADDRIAVGLPVQHAAVLDRYRAAKEISRYAAAGIATTEDLRQAMIHYRALFGELLVQPDPAGPTAGAMPPTGRAPTRPGR